MQIRNILVRATNWIGDAVMSVPALQQLRIAHPGANIAILARPWVAGLYERESFCDQLIPYHAPRGRHGLSAKWQIARELRLRRFDCAVLLQNAFESAAIAKLAGIPVRVGYNRDARGWLLTHSIPVPKDGEVPKHQRFYYLELLRRAKLIPDYSFQSGIHLEGSRSAAALGRRHLSAAGLQGNVIGVSPGAAYGGAKRWLPERFAGVAVALARQRNASIAIFGSEAELPICRIVHDDVKEAGVRAMNFAGNTPLAVFVEIVAACELLLSNDSGPMHIASALGVPTLAVFGATDDIVTGPTGNHSRVIRHPVECSPCLLRECPIDHRCMTRVTAEDVAKEALILLNECESQKR